jgi:hypothetical protein
MPPKKTTAKKPAVLIAEALDEWQNKETAWKKEKIVLEHSLVAARRYLDKVTREKEALAANIEETVDHRLLHSAQSEERNVRLRTRSREVAAQIAVEEEHIQAQGLMLAQMRTDLIAKELEVSTKERSLRRLVASADADDARNLQLRTQILRHRLKELRLREVQLVSTQREVAALAGLAAWESLLTSPYCAAFIGPCEQTGAQRNLRQSMMKNFSTVPEATLVDVLGANPPGPSHPVVPQFAATTVHAGETPAAHISRVLAWLTRPPARGRLLIVHGILMAPSSGLLRIGHFDASPVIIALQDLIAIVRAHELPCIIDAQAASASMATRGWSVAVLPGCRVQCYRQRLATTADDSVLFQPLALHAVEILELALNFCATHADAPLGLLATRITARCLGRALESFTKRKSSTRMFESVSDSGGWPSWCTESIAEMEQLPFNSVENLFLSAYQVADTS